MRSDDRAPLVSVVMIFLNADPFITEAIDSVLAQTHGNWELLMVDDGSMDRSSEKSKRYAEKYPGKIQYLEHDGHKNKGMSASRNLAISHAHGEYIAFLDADDMWLPRKLERQTAILDEHPKAAFVFGRTEWWYSWEGKSDNGRSDFLQKFSVPLDTLVQPPAVLDMFLLDEWASLCDVMVRRSAIEQVGAYEEIFRGMYEDQAFHAKLCFTFPAFVSGESWYRYRQHDRACTTQSHQLGITTTARLMFLSWLENYLAGHNGKNTSTWRIVRKHLFPYRHPQLVRLSGRVRGLVQGVQRRFFVSELARG